MSDPSRSAPDWEAIRAQFPVTRDQIYLNCATYGPGPDCVASVVRESLEQWQYGQGNWFGWEADADQARRLFAELMNFGEQEVALIPAVSVAAGQVAESLPSGPRRNLVVGTGEFRSNLFPWLAQERRGFQVRLVPFRDGRLGVEDVAEAMDRDTALVAVSSVQSSNGFRADLPGLGALCREHGARLFVDATQSAGAMDLPLAEHADFVAVGGYKWLLAPRGACFLRVREDCIDSMVPVASGWRTAQEPLQNFYGPPWDLASDASRFDISLAWHSWVGMRRALEFVKDIGIPAIHERNLMLAKRFRDGLEPIGLAPLFEEHESSSIVGLRVPNAGAVRQSLEESRVIAAVRGDYLRAAFHFFNNEEDVNTALRVLGECVKN